MIVGNTEVILKNIEEFITHNHAKHREIKKKNFELIKWLENDINISDHLERILISFEFGFCSTNGNSAARIP